MADSRRRLRVETQPVSASALLAARPVTFIYRGADMAVKIPQYTEQVSARGPVASMGVPNIRAPSENVFSIAAEGLKQGAGIARELESRDKQAEAEARRLAAEQRHAEEQQAQVWVAQQLPAFHVCPGRAESRAGASLCRPSGYTATKPLQAARVFMPV